MPAGHSLGGALANLCAFDIAAAIKEAGATAEGGHSIEVSCYTFGAPRTGNPAFRSEYNTLVPDSWAVINDQVPSPAVSGAGGGGGGGRGRKGRESKGDWMGTKVVTGGCGVVCGGGVGQEQGLWDGVWWEGHAPSWRKPLYCLRFCQVPPPVLPCPPTQLLSWRPSWFACALVGCGDPRRQDGVPVQPARSAGAGQLPGGLDRTAFLDRGFPATLTWRYCPCAMVTVCMMRKRQRGLTPCIPDLVHLQLAICRPVICGLQVMPCHAKLCHAMLCYAMLCHAMPCHAMPCYAVPCHAMLCHAMLTSPHLLHLKLTERYSVGCLVLATGQPPPPPPQHQNSCHSPDLVPPHRPSLL